MWETVVFKSRAEMDSFISKNSCKFQIIEIFINNAYGLDIKPLKIIDIK